MTKVVEYTNPPHQPRVSLVAKLAARFHVEPSNLMGILKATAFKIDKGEVSNEQMAALLVVADQYGLNPFTREIFAFPDKKNGIVPVVGVDGWSRIINDHPQYDGVEFRYAEKTIDLPDAQSCPEWCEAIIFRKDRGHPTIVREYLEECYRPPFTREDGSKVKGPWQSHTRRFLRHKTLIQGSRIAFGFGGIYDEDEAARVIEVETVRHEPERLSGPAGIRAMAEAELAQAAPEVAGATQTAAEAPVVPAEPGPAGGGDTATLDGLVHAVADYIGSLGEATTRKEVLDIADAAPETVKISTAFTSAVERRLAEISKPGTPAKPEKKS